MVHIVRNSPFRDSPYTVQLGTEALAIRATASEIASNLSNIRHLLASSFLLGLSGKPELFFHATDEP